MKVSAVICAAGRGERAGFDKNKLLAPLWGAPALWHTLKKFSLPEIDEIIIAVSERDFNEISALAAPFGAKIVLGGKTRTESVRAALEEVTGDITLVHDGARPFLTRNLLRACIDGVKKYGSAICAVKASDTVLYGEKQDALARDEVYLLQTPQGFYSADIKRAYALAGDKNYTDDSAVYRAYVAQPTLIEGETGNRKLTYKSDFDYFPLPLSRSDGVGFGVDTHVFGEGKFITLGGVKLECGKSLIAHSDGDVLVHAIMDALLGAAGLKDIGHYFPDGDERFKGANSLEMLKEVSALLKEKGFAPLNLSASIQAEKPRLKDYIDEMRANVARAAGLEKDRVAIAAGTSEGVGFVGEGLGITAYCAANLIKI